MDFFLRLRRAHPGGATTGRLDVGDGFFQLRLRRARPGGATTGRLDVGDGFFPPPPSGSPRRSDDWSARRWRWIFSTPPPSGSPRRSDDWSARRWRWIFSSASVGLTPAERR